MLCTHMYGALGSRRFAAAAGCWDLPSRHVDGHSKHSTSTSHLLNHSSEKNQVLSSIEPILFQSLAPTMNW
jgi:hypothetical protein